MNQGMKFWVVALCMIITMTKSNGQEDYGVQWAFLVAGSKGYENYRHQSDVCHAYQLLKSGGLKDENIIVMMYDDIAYNFENPYPGNIINQPEGPNVYYNVPKDYTGKDANLEKFYAVLSGDKSKVKKGSGKVLNTNPEDTIFIFMSSHGSSGVIVLPDEEFIYADQFINALKMKSSYNKMVIYLESCYGGTIFQGLLPNNDNIYATTASNAYENSFGFYCPNEKSPPSPAYKVCLGDLYSISWLEYGDENDRKSKNLNQQYIYVWDRTFSTDPKRYSHVMRYGNMNMGSDVLVTYFGAKQSPNNDNYHFNTTPTHDHSYKQFNTTTTGFVSQQDARLLYLNLKLKDTPDDSMDKLKAQIELDNEISRRKHEDQSVYLIWKILFGQDTKSIMMANLRSDSQPLVDDWNCLRILKKTYEYHCGVLSHYGLKYMQSFANMCNNGISKKQMMAAASEACLEKNKNNVP